MFGDTDGLIWIAFYKKQTVVRSPCTLFFFFFSDRFNKRERDILPVPTTVGFNDMTIETEQILFGLKKQLGLGAISGKRILNMIF